ncbi:DUF6515 family protein [Microbulbifer sp. SAOS-129_SWC]|uniref:DUF6515 family protein n=1 Tax=Microbulbifer sp. SAOS-129_SWC TaxID=3145235 RepID=UPI0032168BC6
MKTSKLVLAILGIIALGAFAFVPPVDASPREHARGGHGYHHPYHWSGRHYGRHYGHRYGRHYGHLYGGPRISIGFTAPVLPFGFVSLAVGGSPYFYQGGYFYRPAPAGYVVVQAPLGASVVSLPGSAVRVQIGGALYYQYANAYYQWQPAARAYVVVPPPAGAPVAAAAPPAPPAPAAGPVPSGPNGGYAPGQVLEELPVGYTAEIINGVQYYRYGGNYFMPSKRDGKEVYVVVQL